MSNNIRLPTILIFVLMVCLFFILLKFCNSCYLQHSRMNIPYWFNYPAELRHIEGWIYKFSCPETLPWFEERKTIIGLAIVDREDNFILEWQIFESVGWDFAVKIKWEDIGRFRVLLSEASWPASKISYEQKTSELGNRGRLDLSYIYDKNGGKFRLNDMVKRESKTLKKVEELPSNWYVSIKSTKPRPHLLD